ncbi:hypothetical protein Pve01_35190 [Planomonospora venezuelensis]|nr:hypothetical protein Pve01_35190 [Planomonospora venezuelensis]
MVGEFVEYGGAGGWSAFPRASSLPCGSASPPASATSRGAAVPGAKGGPLRRSGFNTCTRWVDVVREMGLPGLDLHDLRHTGSMLAAESGVGLKDLMARMVTTTCAPR